MKEQREVSQPRLWPGMKGLELTRHPVPKRKSTLDAEQQAAMIEVSRGMLHGIETDRNGDITNGVEIVLLEAESQI